MKRVLRISLLVAAVLLMACCGKRVRIIPRSTLGEIFEDMFMADEWLSVHPEASATADTTWFYEPILKKYGYTVEDYQKSVDHYLYDPERFAKMLTKLTERLEKDAKKLEAVEKHADEVKALLQRISKFRPPYVVYDSTFFKGVASQYRVDVQRDSMGRYVVHHAYEDTVFQGPRRYSRDEWLGIEKKDTVQVDTMALQAAADSLKVEDELVEEELAEEGMEEDPQLP